MMRFLSDKISLGLYPVALELFGSIKSISPILVISFAPLFVYKFSDIKTIKRNITILTFLVSSIAAVISVILYLISPFLIQFIFGIKFNDAVEIFQYFTWILPLIFANEALNIFLIKMEFGKIMIYKWLIVLFLSSVLYLILIPKYGGFGAVLGMGIGYLFACVFNILIMIKIKIKKRRGSVDLQFYKFHK